MVIHSNVHTCLKMLVSFESSSSTLIISSESSGSMVITYFERKKRIFDSTSTQSYNRTCIHKRLTIRELLP